MDKLTSLRDNVTNVYAKCRKWNEKKIYESVYLCSVLLSLESTVNYLKSKKYKRTNFPTAKFMVRG